MIYTTTGIVKQLKMFGKSSGIHVRFSRNLKFVVWSVAHAVVYSISSSKVVDVCECMYVSFAATKRLNRLKQSIGECIEFKLYSRALEKL